MVAFNPDPSVFRSGSDFSASLGITPSQHSSGGKDKLGAITKKGNRYLRKMLVVGCTSVLRVAHKYKGALAEWIVAMRARKARARRRRRPGQQAGQNRLGDDVDWREAFPNRTLHEGLTTKRLLQDRRFQFRRDWQAQRRDERHGRNESPGHPDIRHEPRARRSDRDQDCRISSGPAVLYRTNRPDI